MRIGKWVESDLWRCAFFCAMVIRYGFGRNDRLRYVTRKPETGEGFGMDHQIAAAALAAVIVLGGSGAAYADPECSPFLTPPAYTGTVRSPETVLGFPIGSKEVTTAQSDAYLAAVDRDSARVVTGVAATSVKGTALRYAIVGNEQNVTPAGLTKIRKAVRQLMDPDTSLGAAEALAAATPAILWVTGNVHGNEESGADASLRVLFELADRSDCVVKRILDNAIVVILPIQNPDGRKDATRRNAYGFDLNRDWFARTQPETDGKLELLRQYPPVLYIDAHEFSTNHYFFPPNADPIYHEVPDRAFNWINGVYSASIAAEMDRQKIQFFHGAPYDLYAVEYGDTVPTVGFNAAGMTFEKYSGDSIDVRTYEHFVAIWTSLFAGASDKQRILEEWHASYVEAKAQGEAGTLEDNGIYFDRLIPEKTKINRVVRHYFLLDEPGRAREIALLVRRLQRMDVKVWRLKAPLSVADYRPYGGAPGPRTLPAGTYWVPMEQAQKHWVQAMLHEDPYIPVSVSYDVTAWSNPLLMNLSGGSSAAILSPSATVVPEVAAPAPPGAPAGTQTIIGLFEMPGSSTAFASAGSIRYLFKHVWNVPYLEVGAATIRAGLPGIDVLLVPDGYVNYGLQDLGSQGKKALAAWVEAGGRYVGYQGGTELAARTGISTVVLQASHTSAPGTLIRVNLIPGSPLAAGVDPTPASPPSAEDPPTAWVMYNNDNRMTAGLGTAAATYPNKAEEFRTSGLAIGVDELYGSTAIVDERVGSGRAIVFSFDPNFRAWSEGTQRILWNALFGDFDDHAPVAAAASAEERAAAVGRADRAARGLPSLGKAIRIVVRPVDADATRAILQRYGAEFKEFRKPQRNVFLIANREGLSWEEHPFALNLARELRAQLTPISFSVP